MPASEDVRRLFSTYAKNLRLNVPEATPNAVICPICLSEFPEGCLEEADCPLSRGHIFPGAAGGNEFTLECTKCNNTLGSYIDKHLVEANKWAKYKREGGTRKATVEVAGTSLNVQAARSERGLEISEVGKCNAPGKGKEFVDLLTQSTGQIDIKVIYDVGYRPEALAVAEIHTTHLMFFRLFGYEYLLTPGGKAVASWIRDGSLPPGVSLAVQHVGDKEAQALIPLRPGVARLAGHLICLALCLPERIVGTRRVVLLPPFSQPELDAYLKFFPNAVETMKFEMKQMGDRPPFSALEDREYLGFGSIWLNKAFS